MNRMTGLDSEGFTGGSLQGALRRCRIIGLCVVVVSVLLLLCLLSYRAEEMGWSLLNPVDHEEASARPCTNWLGVVGLYIAGVFYWLLGAAAVYGAVLIQAPAWGMLLWPESKRLGQWISWIVMLLSSCAALSVQPWILLDWAERLHLTTPGGKLGYLDGTCCAEALVGRTGALVFLLLLHGIALIYYARITPKLLYHTEKEDVASVWKRWREHRRIRKMQKEEGAHSWRQAAEPRGASFSFPAASQESPSERAEKASPDLVPSVSEELPLDDEEKEEENSPWERTRVSSASPRRASSPRKPGSNLLDLMEPIEDEIERESLSDRDEEETGIRINAHTQRAIEGHFGMKEERKSPAPVSRPAPPRPRREVKRAAKVPKEDYPLPSYELLRYEPVPESVRLQAQGEMQHMQATIADTLESFRIGVEPGDITRGPSVTRYEFTVPRGQSVKAVATKKNDIMAATRSTSVNILAPIPGKSTVGVELENSVKEPVFLRELLQSPEFHNSKLRIPVALGKDVYGHPVIGDLAAMPHVLVGGSTGSGKSVCINSMLISFLYKFRPDELKLILVDPKVVEMQPYKALPHLAVPVVTNPNRVIGALRWAVNEMEHRYRLFSKAGVRNLEDFNNLTPEEREALQNKEDESYERPDARENDAVDAIVRDVESSRGCDIPDEDEEEQQELDFHEDGSVPAHLPYIVIVVDELADLMMQVKEDLENYIGRLTQKARAAGIHLIVATQSPRAQVVTGIIKTNLPSRIALKVSSAIDSRVILDEVGAENLLGRGDLLFLPPGGPSKMTRAQGAFVSDAEIASIIKFCAAHAEQNFVQSAAAALSEPVETSNGGGAPTRSGGGADSDEELYNRCVSLVIAERKASTSLLQRRFSIGYGRAAKIMDMMEERGVISAPQGATRAREVLIS